MTSNIRTYEDLLRRQQQMETLLQAQKELLVHDLYQLKEEFRPAVSALGFIGKITTRDKSNSLLAAGVGGLMETIMRKLVLAKAGWLTRLVVPFFLKNYSSRFVAEHKDEFFERLFSWIGLKNANGKTEEPVMNEEDGVI